MGGLLATSAVMRWLTPSKKKNLLTTNVLTSITKDAAMTARRQTILHTRMTLRTVYPGPARERLKNGIVGGIRDEVVVRQKSETAQRFRKAVLLIRFVTIELASKVLFFEQRRLCNERNARKINGRRPEDNRTPPG